MPRSVHRMNRFEGGLNTEADPRDISDNELVLASDINVDTVGKIRMMGSAAAVTSPNWDALLSGIDGVISGYGIHMFSSDYDIAETASNTDLLAHAGESDGTGASSDGDYICKIYEDDGTAYASEIIINATDSGDFYPSFYYADGGLRICDGNFANTNSTNYWFGYIKRTHFSVASLTDVTDEYDAYYDKANSLTAPTSGVFGQYITGTCSTGGDCDLNTLESSHTDAFENMNTELDKNTYFAGNTIEGVCVGLNSRTDDEEVETDDVTDWDADTYAIYPPAGTGFNLSVTTTGTDGTWTAGDYEFASTFIYDDSQETKLFGLSGTDFTLSSTNHFTVRVYVTGPFDPRISGGRIYTRIADSDDDWTLLVDISMERGIRTTLHDDYDRWQNSQLTPQNFVNNSNILSVLDPNPDTYKSLTGIEDQYKDITAKYKTAVVTNRMAYIGNVEINSKLFSDSIFKSFVNRFDTFTEERRLDVAINDGESIVKLETFADRILEFKEKTLYIINVSQDVEFLESTQRYMGIDYPYQSCETEYGIAWINTKGCYLYTGKNIINLIEKDGLRKVSLSTWDTALGTYPAISYDANKKKLIVFQTLSDTDINILVYDFVTGSWTHGTGKYGVADTSFSNPVTDWNGDVIIYSDEDDEIYKWSNTAAASTSFNMATKDFDGGYPGITKILYKVIITYDTGNATSNVQVRYDTNGGTTFTKDFTPVSGATLSGTVSRLDAANGWATAVLKPDTASESHDIRSWALKFTTDGTVPAGFEINDITYVYRVKGLR